MQTSPSGNSDMELPSVSDDFFEQNKNLGKPSHKSSAPFNKKDRFARRQEVFRLNFELGIPATQISKIMNVNRNTINADIQFWWNQLDKEWDFHSVQSLVMRQMKRLESQRSRLMGYLEKENDPEMKLSIERLLLDVENKMGQLFTNAKYSDEQMLESAVKLLNKWADKNKLEKLYLRQTDLVSVAKEDYEIIVKMIEKSRAKVRNKGVTRL